MRAKDQFLFKLAVQIEIIDTALPEHLQDSSAIGFAQALRELHESLSRFPANHVFFQQWAEKPQPIPRSGIPPVRNATDSCLAAA